MTMKAQNVELIIAGIRNADGQIVIGVFKDNESFQIEKSFMDKRFTKIGISSGEMRVQLR